MKVLSYETIYAQALNLWTAVDWLVDKRLPVQTMFDETFFFKQSQQRLNSLVVGSNIYADLCQEILYCAVSKLPKLFQHPEFSCRGRDNI